MIRKYEERDIERIIDVWYRASLICHPFLEESFLEDEGEKIRNVWLKKAETWVYEQDKIVVGFLALIGNEVGAIFVDPEFQKQGFGHALMDHARKLRGTLELDVFKENRIGRAFYDRYGFEIVKEHIHEQTGNALLRMCLEV